VIPGYRAIIDPAAVGLGFQVLVQVTMDREDASTITGVERGLAAIPEIGHPERLLSDPDYLVRPPPPTCPATRPCARRNSPPCPACSGSPQQS
jgi:hypothetical protein